MSKFIFAYHGGKAPDSPEEGEKVMAQWNSWYQSMGDKVLDGGGPAGQSKTVTSSAVSLSSASGTDATVLYSVTSTASNFNTQTAIDTAVTEIVADASTLVFGAAKLASVLIQVTGSDADDVALFHYTEAGSNGIQSGELDLIGVFVGADPLVAADIL